MRLKLTSILGVTTERETLLDSHVIRDEGLLGEGSARNFLHTGGGRPTSRESDSSGSEITVQ